MWRVMRPPLLVFSLTILFLACGWSWSQLLKNGTSFGPGSIFAPKWTNSYRLYNQPHAIWLDRYRKVGVNQGLLKRTLQAAARAQQIPELVLYSIPMRDLGQASEGGFANYEDYMADNRLNAQWVQRFVRKTSLHPVVYIEPDGLSLAVQYRREQAGSPEAETIYQQRVETVRTLVAMYHHAGAKVYLDAGHSGWFDYGPEDLQRIADALNAAGMADADGIASNISNRQPILTTRTRLHGEAHYLERLLPLLHTRRKPDVRVDTSRNGGLTQTRQYYLAPAGELIDNENPLGRLVGHWESTPKGEIRLMPFFGKIRPLSRLIGKEKYTFDTAKSILLAPPWLDAVGDVQLGSPPTDTPPAAVAQVIQHYRYIKPPDDCDGALNCPPGASKQEVNLKTSQKQPLQTLPLPKGGWLAAKR
jgi:hypothetical protein